MHPRVYERHSDMGEEIVLEAWNNTLRSRPRDTDPVQWVGVGYSGGRLVEYIAIENLDASWLIFHAMKATRKTLKEWG